MLQAKSSNAKTHGQNKEQEKTKKIMINGNTRAEWDGKIIACKSKGCGARIGYGVTSTGSRIAFNFDDLGHTSHSATCPDAKEFRREKK